MAPRADLESERNEKERFMSAYQSLAEQSARTAGAASDAARFESEKTFLQQKLELTEAALATATQTSEEKAKSLDKLSAEAHAGGERTPGGRSKPADSVHELKTRVQSLTISEAGALSRAQAAERVLEEAMAGRKEVCIFCVRALLRESSIGSAPALASPPTDFPSPPSHIPVASFRSAWRLSSGQ